jgi:hypothetical protein
MTEQVIDIRDRIEKMRTQIDGSPQKSNHSQNPSKVSHANNLVPKESKDKTMQQINKKIEIEKNDKIKTIQNISNDNAKQNNSENLNEEQSSETSQQFYKFEEKLRKKESQKKVYKDYHNENIFDENKKSVKLDKENAFPQFNLNVSNPISWKLMLLIMLMQLLTNIMLVVVLYLK